MFNARRPFGEVHGTGVAGARYYQDGQYYDVDYKYVFSDPGADPPRGSQRRSMEQANAEMLRREAAREQGLVITEDTGTQPAREPAPAAPPLPEAGPQTEGATLTKEQQLMQLNVPRLQEMQLKLLKQQNDAEPEGKRKQEKELRAEIIKGPGAKEKLIDFLVKNTD